MGSLKTPKSGQPGRQILALRSLGARAVNHTGPASHSIIVLPIPSEPNVDPSGEKPTAYTGPR
jgi:hypothetical protein